MCERCEELRQEHREARWRWNREKVELLMGESPWCGRLWRMIEHLRDRLARTQRQANEYHHKYQAAMDFYVPKAMELAELKAWLAENKVKQGGVRMLERRTRPPLVLEESEEK